MSFVGEVVQHDAFSDYSLRLTEPDVSLCDASVKQHAGFLDISDGKHLFFWYVRIASLLSSSELTSSNINAGSSSQEKTRTRLLSLSG